jgi:glycosyltransferase involved in cell wall biosynthesis
LRTVTGQGGGPEKTILNSPRFIGAGFEMRLAYLRPRHDRVYDMPARARDSGVELIDIPETGPLDPRALWQLTQAIRKFKPDILHAHDYKTNLLAIMCRRWSGAAALTTMHGSGVWSPRLSLYYRLDRWTLPRMDHVIAVSRDVQQTALSLGVPSSRCSLVHNAIDATYFRRNLVKARLREKLGLPADRVIVGAVGRLSREKGFDVLTSAVRALLRSGHRVHLIIVGDGPERDSLMQLISSLGCDDHVQLLGYRSDVIELFHCMDMFVLSSLREALPNVVLEAMAMEVPVVATRVAGVPDVIQDQENGLLVDPGDSQALAAAIEQLIRSPSWRHRLSGAARATIEQRFSFEERMKKIRQIYESVLNRRR